MPGPITFVRKNDSLYHAVVESPLGKTVNIDPDSLECTIVHKRGKKGFGLEFTTSDGKKTLHIGTVGETSEFLKTITSELKRGFFTQTGKLY